MHVQILPLQPTLFSNYITMKNTFTYSLQNSHLNRKQKLSNGDEKDIYQDKKDGRGEDRTGQDRKNKQNEIQPNPNPERSMNEQREN